MSGEELKGNKNEENEQKKEDESENSKKITSKFNFLDHAKYSATTEGALDEASSKNIIFLGSKNSGKTSLINALLTVDSSSSGGDSGAYGPTNGINYNYLKLSNKRKIINLYEIGGGIESINLLKQILTPQNAMNTMICIVLDFGKPKQALKMLLKFLNEIKNYVDIIKGSNQDIIEQITEKKKDKLPQKKVDRNMSIIPLEIYVVGNKYDILEKINAEELKWVCRTLRFFSYINGINLLYTSTQSQQLIKNLHITITNFSSSNEETYKFKSEQLVDKNDMNPIYVNYYNDSIEEIGDPKVMKGGKGNIESLWEETFNTLFKSMKEEDNNETNEIEFMESWWNEFKETKIDNEVKLFQRNKEKKSKGFK